MAPIGESKLITPSTIVAQALGLPVEDQYYEFGYNGQSLTLTGYINDHCREVPDPNAWGYCELKITLNRQADGKVRIDAPPLRWFQRITYHRIADPMGWSDREFFRNVTEPSDCTPKDFKLSPPSEQQATIVLTAVLRAMGHDIPAPDPLRQAVLALQGNIAAADATTFTIGERVSWVEGNGERVGTPDSTGHSVSYARVPPAEARKVHTGTVTSDGQSRDGKPDKDIDVVDDATGRPYMVPRGNLTELPQLELRPSEK